MNGNKRCARCPGRKSQHFHKGELMDGVHVAAHDVCVCTQTCTCTEFTLREKSKRAQRRRVWPSMGGEWEATMHDHGIEMRPIGSRGTCTLTIPWSEVIRWSLPLHRTRHGEQPPLPLRPAVKAAQ